MNIIFYVPGMPFDGGTIASGKSLGGSETSGYYLARELSERGHVVTVFSNCESAGVSDGVMYMPIGQRSQQFQFGEGFERYARYTPSDVLIAQRVPNVFSAPFASKLNLWWTHDLALKRTQGALGSQMWNVDGVLCVSEWHRHQICSVYDLPSDFVHVIRNAIDPSLFTRPFTPDAKKAGRFMMYTSRPERGLMHLVEFGGIMERLLRIDPSLTLKVAGYDNTVPDMEPLYQRLWDRCRALPNVELLGPLGKRDLARHMQGAWLHLYPTTFEEVSCITAMEAQAAGTPFVASPVAALPETLDGEAGVSWVAHSDTHAPNLDGFVKEIIELRDDPVRWDDLHHKAIAKGNAYRYADSASDLETLIERLFASRVGNPTRLFKHFVRHGDLDSARRIDVAPALKKRLDKDYSFARDDKSIHAHYDRIAQWENARGITHGNGHDDYLMNSRMIALCNDLRAIPDGGVVLDYGCGQGHYTEFLARQFPHLGFVGYDFCAQSIARGKEFMAARPLENLKLMDDSEFNKGAFAGKCAAVIAGELIEHVIDPAAMVQTLESLVQPGGWMYVQTPWGPWEADGRVLRTGEGHENFKSQFEFRAHLHHFEADDLRDMFGLRKDFHIVVAPTGFSSLETAVGCFHTRWRVADHPEPVGEVDWARKLSKQAPRETLGVMMICVPDSKTIGKTLERLAPIADQIVIGVDGGAKGKRTSGPTWNVGTGLGAECFPIVSPLTQGFDAARNEVMAKIRTDWGLWIDDDEVLMFPERLPKYLRRSMYTAFAIAQHHYSAEPAGAIKTDFPCRLIRLDAGLRFRGVVHEHPETEINKGAGRVCVATDISIMHNGYDTEATRRARFQRNIPLMVRDRALYPERILGKMLWIRDLVHMNRFDLERGSQNPALARQRAEEAIALWREIVSRGETRLAIDALPYYGECSQFLHGPDAIRWAGSMGAKRQNVGSLNGAPPQIIEGMFASASDIRLLIAAMSKDSLAPMEDRYF